MPKEIEGRSAGKSQTKKLFACSENHYNTTSVTFFYLSDALTVLAWIYAGIDWKTNKCAEIVHDFEGESVIKEKSLLLIPWFRTRLKNLYFTCNCMTVILTYISFIWLRVRTRNSHKSEFYARSQLLLEGRMRGR